MNLKTNYVIAKGCIDYFDESYKEILNYKQILEKIFEHNGGIPLETPIFENRNVLMNKYEEEGENKLVYNIEDNGEPITMRYDHTIPLIRFVKENGIKKLRRYSIGKVYRRDNPQLSKGRLCEFYQGDFDIIGESNNSMLPEIIILKMINDFMKEIKQLNYIIYINHTDNLKTILCEKLGLNYKNFKRICSLIDKIDWNNFEKSFVEINLELLKFFSEEQINNLKKYIQNNIPLNEKVNNFFEKIMEYSQIFNFEDKIKFNSCLARGLDYYNGFIFEVKLESFENTIIAGGRYDYILDNNTYIGVSFGISRIFQLLNHSLNKNWKDIIFVSTLGKITIKNKLEIINKLPNILKNYNINYKSIIWNTDIESKKLTPIITECINNYYKYLIIIAENEIKNNKIIIKDLENHCQNIISL